MLRLEFSNWRVSDTPDNYARYELHTILGLSHIGLMPMYITITTEYIGEIISVAYSSSGLHYVYFML